MESSIYTNLGGVISLQRLGKYLYKNTEKVISYILYMGKYMHYPILASNYKNYNSPPHEFTKLIMI